MSIYWYEGRPVAIAVEGRKHLQAIAQEADGLRVIKIPRGTRLKPVLYHGRPYPKRRASGHYGRLVRLPGTTKQARKLLKRWRDQ